MSVEVCVLNNILPEVILFRIQHYLPVKSVIKEAIQNYYIKLHLKKEFLEESIWQKYIYPNCYCKNCPDNGRNKIFKRRDCDPCFRYEVNVITNQYAEDNYRVCIIENPQYEKIAFNKKNDEDSDESSCYSVTTLSSYYSEEDMWLE